MATGAIGWGVRVREAAVAPEPQPRAIDAVRASTSEPPSRFQSCQVPLILNTGAKRPAITFEQTVEPDTGGIKLTPSGPVVVTPPAPKPPTLLVEGTLQAFRPGTYTVTAGTTINQTGKTAGARPGVNVIAPEGADVRWRDAVRPPRQKRS